MSDYSKLKQLAEALENVNSRYLDDETNNELGDEWSLANDHFVDATSPEVVLGLIAENERLAADNASMRGSLKSGAEMTKKAIKDGGRAARERDVLKAECEGLRKDAGRYQWLRELASSQDLRFPLMGKPAWIDENIDAAMSKEASHG